MRLFVLFCLHACFCIAQNNETIRGRVIHSVSRQAVFNAMVIITGDKQYFVFTDSSGRYQAAVQTGAYGIKILHNDFEPNQRQNVVVSKGKQEVQDFELNEISVALDTVEVSVESIPGAFELDTRNNQRHAATFYDPARVVNAHAGVINVDDQSNSVSVHGTSPNYLQWKIEGVEVVNPNHLENSGMMNDRPAYNGGGVSMISNQLLERSAFYFAPFDATQGNALSGIFDIRLRKGNEERREHTIQVSLLGTDISMEGPFPSKHKASYIFNVRYSTIGLLSFAGIDFGEEKISFADFSWQLAFPFKKAHLRLFGVAGTCSNIFKGKTDTSQVEIQKELQNINYKAQTAIQGFSFISSLSNTLYLKSVVAYSVKNTSRIASPSVEFSGMMNENDHLDQQKISSVIYLAKRISSDFRLKAGSYINHFISSVNSQVNSLILVNSRLDELLFQPFLNFEGNVHPKLRIEGGLHSMILPRINFYNIQPRCLLTFKISGKQSLTLSYGSASQIQPAHLLLSSHENRTLAPTISQNFSVSHNIRIKTLKLKTEGYYQLFKNVPFNDQGFSAFNYFNGLVMFPLKQDGRGEIYGVDLSIERNVRDFYVTLSSGIFKSVYSNNRISYDARFNSGYNIALSTGNDFVLKDKRKTIGIHLRAFARNGFREPADLMLADPTIYGSQLSSYYRVDFRISYKKERNSSSYIWALDLQNVTNARNVVYNYYDHFTGQITPRYQLGLIPVLSYKVFF